MKKIWILQMETNDGSTCYLRRIDHFKKTFHFAVVNEDEAHKFFTRENAEKIQGVILAQCEWKSTIVEIEREALK